LNQSRFRGFRCLVGPAAVTIHDSAQSSSIFDSVMPKTSY